MNYLKIAEDIDAMESQPKKKYDLRVIYAVGTDKRICVLDHGHDDLPDGFEEDIYYIQDECTATEDAGVYLGVFKDYGYRDWESGFWEPEWCIDMVKLLYTYPTIKEFDDGVQD